MAQLLTRLTASCESQLCVSTEFSLMYVQFVIAYSLFKTHATETTGVLESLGF